MKKLLYIPGVIMALAVLMAVFLTCIESVVYSGMELFRTEYEKYGICELMDMEMGDLLGVMEHTLGYMRGDEEELQVTTTVAGERVDFYNEREISHMVDVRNLVVGAFFLRAALAAAALLCLLIILAGRPPRLARTIALSFLIGAVIFLAFIVFIAVFAAVDFTAFWTRFHGVLFTNDLWLLNPATDRMINICPEGLFHDIVVQISLRFGIVMAAVLAASAAVTVKTGNRKKCADTNKKETRYDTKL